MRADEDDGEGPRLPVIGRPEFFDEEDGPIGAFQKPVVRAAPTDVQVEDPITLTIRVQAGGKVERPPKHIRLEKFPDLADRFYVEYPDDPVFHRIDDRTWEFTCTLKPRRTNVAAVPSFPFVFYVSGLLPPERGFQIHRTESVAITVRPRTEVQPSDVARGVESMPTPESVQQITEGSSVLRLHRQSSAMGWVIIGCAGLLVPALGFLTFAVIWPRFSTNAAKRASARRSLAAKKALAALARVPYVSGNDEQAAIIVARFLRERFELSSEEPTPIEVERHLESAGFERGASGFAADFFRAYDAVRYAHVPPTVNSADSARQVVLRLEAGPCPESASS